MSTIMYKTRVKSSVHYYEENVAIPAHPRRHTHIIRTLINLNDYAHIDSNKNMLCK